MSTNVILAFGSNTTAIPYDGSAREETPHGGFIPLKGHIELVDEIEAARENGALKRALTTINDNSTPFFTVACRLSLNNDGREIWARGYLEFAFNYLDIVRDSPNYFLLFEQFNRYLAANGFDLPVDYKFELHQAEFKEKGVQGYTSCVWITTSAYGTAEEPQKIWNQSVGILGEFLGNFAKPDMEPLY